LLRRCFYASNRVTNTGGGLRLGVGRRRRRTEARRGRAGRAGASGGALYRGAGEGPGVARTPRGGGGAPDFAMPGLSTLRCGAPMGRSGPSRCGSGPRARPKPKGGVFLFLEIIFNAKVFPEKSREYIDGTENTRKIPGKFSEVD
jgi:hypothetical protein